MFIAFDHCLSVCLSDIQSQLGLPDFFYGFGKRYEACRVHCSFIMSNNKSGFGKIDQQMTKQINLTSLVFSNLIRY